MFGENGRGATVLPIKVVLDKLSKGMAVVDMVAVVLKSRSIGAVLYGASLGVFEGIVTALSSRRAGITKMRLRYLKESGVR